MEFIPVNEILEFAPDTLKTIRKQYNFDNPGEMDGAIDALEAWISKQEHFKKKEFPRNYLEKMIIANKGSIERAKTKLDKICTFRTIVPEFFGDNLTNNDFSDLDELTSILLPKTDENHYRVYILKNTSKTYNATQITNYFRFLLMICEYLLAYDYSDGVIIFLDYSGTNLFDLIKHLDLTELRTLIKITTEGYGMRLKGIHILSQSKAVETIVTILKQLLSDKIGSRISVHRDISTVYQHIPKDILPSEYGGKEKSYLKLRSDLLNTLTGKAFKEFVEEINKAKTDETLRPRDKFNEQYMGMPGSFRTLSVD